MSSEENTNNEETKMYFKTIPIDKVLLLSISTFGLYNCFLSYNYWKIIKENKNIKISPLARAFFLVLYNFKLFPILENYLTKHGIVMSSGTSLAVTYLILNILIGILEDVSSIQDNNNFIFEYLAFLVLIFMSCIFVSIQNNINKVNSEHYKNAPKDNWNIFNILWLIIVGIIYILSIF